MDVAEYLVSYGRAGDFARFRPEWPLACGRGDRLVVTSPRGLEVGVVMRPAGPGHQRLLAERFVGRILRTAGPADEEVAERLRHRGQKLFEAARRYAAELSLPLEIVDAEVLFDGRQGILYHVRLADCDPRPLIEALADEFRLLVSLHDLTAPAPPPEHEHGCGAPDCGGGNCGSCGTGGGCGTCSSHGAKVTAGPADRVPLL